jgi:hypothetical protein
MTAFVAAGLAKHRIRGHAGAFSSRSSAAPAAPPRSLSLGVWNVTALKTRLEVVLDEAAAADVSVLLLQEVRLTRGAQAWISRECR